MTARVTLLAAASPLAAVLLLAAAVPPSAPPRAAAPPTETFVRKYCAACHEGAGKQGGLDLIALLSAGDAPDNLLGWIKVHDRVQAGEMPPPEMPVRPTAAEQAAFLKALSASLNAQERALTRRALSVPKKNCFNFYFLHMPIHILNQFHF